MTNYAWDNLRRERECPKDCGGSLKLPDVVTPRIESDPFSTFDVPNITLTEAQAAKDIAALRRWCMGEDDED
jgi:hypothetical protein